MAYPFLPVLMSMLTPLPLEAPTDANYLGGLSFASHLDTPATDDSASTSDPIDDSAWHQDALDWFNDLPMVPRVMIGTDNIHEFQGSLGVSFLSGGNGFQSLIPATALTLRGTAGRSGYGGDVGISAIGVFWIGTADLSLSYLRTNSNSDDVIPHEDYYGIKLDIGFALQHVYAAWYTNLDEDEFFMLGFGIGF